MNSPHSPLQGPPEGGHYRSSVRSPSVVTAFSRTIPGATYLLVVLAAVFAIFGHAFATLPNILNIGVQSSVLLLLALPMTLVIMTEGIDLSIGAVLSLCGVV